MSRFYGSLRGSAKTTATRRGFDGTGVAAHVRGWNFGVRTELHVCRKCGGDAVEVSQTGGSNNPGDQKRLILICENGCNDD